VFIFGSLILGQSLRLQVRRHAEAKLKISLGLWLNAAFAGSVIEGDL
jgi:hypothetical protein